ncbi:hypothetical protein [Thalassomonas sp. RHCl1]|uniref:HEAT repeat domain-containing protein n=1 Tax=Thalassomonas sp. RHCl1 TaxID=2995320 RepID=UPI00248AF2DB|nr:hypothetical protein [Thalassomonas sp. RHCl1]
MEMDQFFSVLAKSDSVDSIETAFFEYVEQRNFKQEIQQLIDKQDYELLGRVRNDGIVLYEDKQWRMLLTLDALTTDPNVAVTFSSESLYSVISNHRYVLHAYPEDDEGIQVTDEKNPITTRQLKLLSSGFAYEFYKPKEKVVVALHNKSIKRQVCARYCSKTGQKLAAYSGTHNLDRYKMFIGIMHQFGTTGSPFLEQLTKHPVNAIRWHALVELFKLDHERAKHILVSFLQDQCPTIRAQANATMTQLAEFERINA